MSHNISYSVLPVYDALEMQLHRRPYYVAKDIYPLVAVQGFVPPFQFVRPKSTANITEFKLISLKTAAETNLLSEMNTAGLKITKYVDYTNDIADTGTNGGNTASTSWGWTLGIPAQFDAVRFRVDMWDATHLGTYWTVRIRTAPSTVLGNQILAESTLARTQTLGLNSIEVGFSEIIDNEDLATLWIEVISDGYWNTVGNQAGAGSTNYTSWPPMWFSNEGTPIIPVTYQYDAWSQTTCQLAYDIISYPGLTAMTTLPTIGNYYFRIADGTSIWYSEVFNIRSEVNGYMKVTFWHDVAIQYKGGHIRFKFPFKFYFYTPTWIGVPEYPIENDVQKRNGYDYTIRTTTFKLFKATMMANEYICDMLRLIVHCSEVVVESLGFTYYVDKFTFQPKWDAKYGDIAEAELEFTTDTVITTTGLGKRNSTQSAAGDFSQSDYNEDFLIS